MYMCVYNEMLTPIPSSLCHYVGLGLGFWVWCLIPQSLGSDTYTIWMVDMCLEKVCAWGILSSVRGMACVRLIVNHFWPRLLL